MAAVIIYLLDLQHNVPMHVESFAQSCEGVKPFSWHEEIHEQLNPPHGELARSKDEQINDETKQQNEQLSQAASHWT